MNKKIVFLPNNKKNHGSGHLSRCIEYVKQSNNASLCLLSGKDNWTKSEVQAAYGDDFDIIDEKNTQADIAIIDFRESNIDILAMFPNSTMLIGLDEGRLRDSFDYLIDTLENLNDDYPANLFCPEFLNLPAKKAKPAEGPNKILISFGGEDPADLTNLLMLYIQKNNLFPNAEITVVKGPFFKKELELPKNYKLLENPKNLKNILADYDLVFTSYGLTAYEAKAAATPFLLLNPEAYHEALSQKAGFTSLGYGNISNRVFKDFLADYSDFSKRLFESKFSSKNFPNFLENLYLAKKSCPICTSEPAAIIARFEDKNYHQCNNCNTTFTQLINSQISDYTEDYFFDDYKKQYGKTYLEDFKHIKSLAMPRLSIIDELLKNRTSDKQKTLLDIGCAYGPFISAAADLDYSVVGMDICEAAINYINLELGYAAYCVDFSKDLEFEQRFDAITMWYVIEHFLDLNLILKNVYKLLNKDGVFAFSTPDLSGISAITDLNAFLEKSPNDHTVILSKKNIKALLHRFGFKVVKIKSIGHHAERFPFFTKSKKLNKLLIYFYNIISKVFGLGDSFEVYARKIEGFYE